MEENLQPEVGSKNQLMKVTPLSKYLALILFIAIPFIGGYVGYVYAPEKIVETEKIIYREDSDSREIINTLEQNAETKKIVSQQEPVSNLSVAVSDQCKFFWASTTFSNSQRFECEKEYSKIDTNGYSRFSYYPDKINLSGTYQEFLFDENDESNFWTLTGLHFLPDTNEFNKLPVSDYIDEQKTINFRNYDIAEDRFEVQNENYSPEKGKFCTVLGKATIEISEIIIDNFEGGIPLSYRLEAQLDKIIEKTPYTITCKN